MFTRFCAVVGFVLVGLFASGEASAADLTITVENLRNDKGQILLCVFAVDGSDVKLFPDCKKGKPVRMGNSAIAGGKAVFSYNGLKEGAYAVALIHDENSNGDLETNIVGIPTEGLGISNNPTLYGKPNFSEGKFDLTGKKEIKITAKYFL